MYFKFRFKSSFCNSILKFLLNFDLKYPLNYNVNVSLKFRSQSSFLSTILKVPPLLVRVTLALICYRIVCICLRTEARRNASPLIYRTSGQTPLQTVLRRPLRTHLRTPPWQRTRRRAAAVGANVFVKVCSERS